MSANGKIKRVAILGFGGEGRSVLKFLRKNKDFKNCEIWILDRSEKISAPAGARLQLGENYLKNLENFDVIFRSPGVPYNLPEIKNAIKNGVEFSSATKLFFKYTNKISGVRIIGVTGTKGKGTTSTLIYRILRAAGKDVYIAGNIGTPATEILSKLKRDSIVVLELSSFQLQDLERSPKIAAILETFPDHQDSHKNLEEYYGSKSNIAKHQKATDAVFFFGDHGKSSELANMGEGKKMPVFPKKFIGFDEAELKIKGSHNFRNAVLATAVAQYLKIPKKTIVRVVKNFRGLEHRLEFVRVVGNVSFYNDSASTNPQTSSAALRSFPNDSISIILGGYDKGLDYAPLKKAVMEVEPRGVVLMGANQKKNAKALEGCETKIVFAKNLKSAIDMAYLPLITNRSLQNKSSSVVFSPGAASFDMFKNYADRGEQFKKIVNSL